MTTHTHADLIADLNADCKCLARPAERCCPVEFPCKISRAIAALQSSEGKEPSKAWEAGYRTGLANRAIDFRPGVFRCPKCGLRSVTVNMDVATGFTEGAQTSDCPNDCGPAWPVTWKDDCLSAERELEAACEKLIHPSEGKATEGEDAVGAAEREVGRAVYTRIEALMNAKAGTSEGTELSYLADLVQSVEEYGSWNGPVAPSPEGEGPGATDDPYEIAAEAYLAVLRRLQTPQFDNGMGARLGGDPDAFAEIAPSPPVSREAVERVFDEWLAVFGPIEIEHTSARDYACDAVKDIRDHVLAMFPAPPPAEGK